MKGERREGVRKDGGGGRGGSYLVNRGLEDNLGLARDLHSQTNWKSDTHIQMSKSVYPPTHTNTQSIACR